MNKKIIGLDVCKDCVVAWAIDDPSPRNHKAYWAEKCKSDQRTKKHQEDPLTFFYNQLGINGLLGLKGDIWALEPTGGHYSDLIEKVAIKEGIELLRVGHSQSKHFRKQIKLPGKNDLADAYAIARYTQLYYGVTEYFVTIPPETRELKRLFLQLKSIDRFRSPLMARLRQQLAYEFPEAMNNSNDLSKDGRRALICWLCDRFRNKRAQTYWDKIYSNSVTHHYGIEISDFTKQLAQKIDDYDILTAKLESQLKRIVFSPIFSKYHLIFDDFNFTLMLRAILLATIYPFKGNYPTMAQFKKRVGCAMDEESSGDSEGWKSGKGSAMCRSQFYLWCYTMIQSKRNRPRSPVGIKISEKYDSWKENYASNPETWVKHIEDNAVRKILKLLRGLLPDSAIKAIESEAIVQISPKANPTREVSRKFSNLIIGKTIGFTARLLYRELSRRL